MTPSTDNLRVKRTKILLRDALIGLIEEQGFDAITIGALTERAMVSRAAFYRNYQDKYDLGYDNDSYNFGPFVQQVLLIHLLNGKTCFS